jgi:hypothetical protein
VIFGQDHQYSLPLGLIQELDLPGSITWRALLRALVHGTYGGPKLAAPRSFAREFNEWLEVKGRPPRSESATWPLAESEWDDATSGHSLRGTDNLVQIPRTNAATAGFQSKVPISPEIPGRIAHRLRKRRLSHSARRRPAPLSVADPLRGFFGSVRKTALADRADGVERWGAH